MLPGINVAAAGLCSHSRIADDFPQIFARVVTVVLIALSPSLIIRRFDHASSRRTIARLNEHRSASRFTVLGWLAIGCWLAAAAPARAEHYREDFENSTPSWSLAGDLRELHLIRHARLAEAAREGALGEFFELRSNQAGEAWRLEHDLPPTRVHDELQARIWLKTSIPGLQLAVRVTPILGDRDEPLESEWIPGEQVETAGRWQQLVCRTTNRVVQERIALWRARGFAVERRDLVVDGIALVGTASPAAAMVAIDSLEFGPLVAPRNETLQRAEQAARSIKNAPKRDVEFTHDRLLVNHRSLFLRMIRDHGEAPELLRQLQFNAVWTTTDDDRPDAVTRLADEGLWAVVTPPSPRVAVEQTSATAATSRFPNRPAPVVGMRPFGDETSNVLFWMLGTRLDAQSMPELTDWIQAVQQADRVHHRPVAVDVAADERGYSRQVEMLGISRHVLQTSLSFSDYRDWLKDRRTLAKPGAFCWTWLQADPSNVIGQPNETRVHTLEPEQLRAQVYAALAAGYRGLGFWTNGPIDGESLADRERRLALRQLNLELSLLEPWIATQQSQLTVNVTDTAIRQQPINQLSLGFGNDPRVAAERQAKLNARENRMEAAGRKNHELTATILHSDFGALLLPMWLEDYSQYVPAQATAAQVSMIVPGANESAAVWELSTTGLRGDRATVTRERVTGGLQVTLNKLDQTAAILLTSDDNILGQLQRRIQTIQQESAQISVELAQLRLQRVTRVDQQLADLGVGQIDRERRLDKARYYVQLAEARLAEQQFDPARRQANAAVELLRALQRDYWDDAVRNLSQPTASPYALSFELLPAHWKLMQELGRSREQPTAKLLQGGSFEDFDTLVAAGWKRLPGSAPGVRATAEVAPYGRDRTNCLRLAAAEAVNSTAPAVLTETPIQVTTPPLRVRAGQLVVVGGWVRLPMDVRASADGVVVYDSILGKASGLRFRRAAEWQRIELLREVPASGDLTLTIALCGLGEVLLDDLEVTVHDRNDARTARR